MQTFFRRNLQGKFIIAPPTTRSAPPQAEQDSILGHFLLGGLDLEVYLVVLHRLLRATTKNVNFFEKKVHPR